MRNGFLLVGILCASLVSRGQSKTTQALQDKFEGSLSLYFYKNTLRMLNQKDDKDFDEMIRNIEKLKFLMISKNGKSFGPDDYQKLLGEYRSESYEPIITGRFDGRNLDVYLNDRGGSTPGTVLLVNDSSALYVLDMIGTIDVSKAGALFSALDGSSDIGERIKDFTDHGDRRKRRRGIKID